MGPKRRGGKREACDNCREGKRKCDRPSRLELGEERCSRCADQDRDCCIPNDTRMYEHPCLERGTSASVQDTGVTLDEMHPSRISSEPPFNSGTHTARPQNGPGALMESYDSSPFPSSEGTAATIPQDDELSPLSTDLYALNSQESSFLHHVFLGGPRAQSSDTSSLARSRSHPRTFNSPAPETRATALMMPELPQLYVRSDAFRLARSHFYNVYVFGAARPIRDFYHYVITVGEIAISDFMESLHAYFDFAALYRPFIPEDAFWQDFHADRCSPVLLLAISCRGIPFTDAKDKWKKQRRLATMFKTEFLKAVTARARTGQVRLDVLEGMALMVDFPYKNARTAADHSCDLFMAPNALVLMSLQSRKRGPRTLDPSAFLARAEERFTLLYWDVFRLDAFECLEEKSLSLIPDDALGLTDDITNHEAGSYLDAILSLSIIVRQIVGKLCNASTKAAGIVYGDITTLYERLCYWRQNVLPLELQTPIDREDESPVKDRTARGSTPIPTGRVTRLQRAILWALEINCYLQIDDCVAKYGLQNGNSVLEEVIGAKTLEVVQKAVNLANSIKANGPDDISLKEKPLVDIAPYILRDTCASMCSWICLRGTKLPKMLGPQVSNLQRQRRADYAGIAKMLRDTIVVASSHADTKRMLGHLDERIASLQEA